MSEARAHLEFTRAARKYADAFRRHSEENTDEALETLAIFEKRMEDAAIRWVEAREGK